MSRATPSIILVGKGKGKLAADAQQLISSINPSTVPFNMVEDIIVEMNDGTRYKIDHTLITSEIFSDNLREEIDNMKIPGDRVQTIEVHVDLIKTKMLVDSETNSLLSEYFSESD